MQSKSKPKFRRHSFLYTKHTPNNDDHARNLYREFYKLPTIEQTDLLHSFNLLAPDERDLPLPQRLQRGLVRAAKFGLFHELQREIKKRLLTRS